MHHHDLYNITFNYDGVKVKRDRVREHTSSYFHELHVVVFAVAAAIPDVPLNILKSSENKFAID